MKILRVADQDRLDGELRAVHVICSERSPLSPFPYLREGIRVEVRSGPFRGMQGLILNRTSRDRLILQVTMIGSAISIELDGALLDVIE